jgi:type VI protein secretion system component VasA
MTESPSPLSMLLSRHTKRREFITLIGGVAALWPLAARAQQPAMPVVGFLRSGTLTDVPHRVTAFQHGLKETGFVEGQNVAIEYRSAKDQTELPLLVAVIDYLVNPDFVLGQAEIADAQAAARRHGLKLNVVNVLNERGGYDFDQARQ